MKLKDFLRDSKFSFISGANSSILCQYSSRPDLSLLAQTGNELEKRENNETKSNNRCAPDRFQAVTCLRLYGGIGKGFTR
ncbi:MAG: hypothetical protein GY795_49885 [Desulfobacterales bacterium]|nr:hypothetical protein [Desulfobacterales bacterium]